MKKLLWCVIAAIGFVCISCGKSNNLHAVSGSVTYKGKPAAGATVFFRRPGGNSMSDHAIMGIVREDGSYTLVCGSLGDGAPPGEYDVFIEWKQNVDKAKGSAQKRQNRFKGRYADSKSPRLHAVVKPEANHLDPFELAD